VHAPHEEGSWAPGAASSAWLHRSLQALDADLRARGSGLVLATGDSLPVLQRLLEQSGAEAVFWNRRYEPAAQARDADIKRALREQGLDVRSFNGSLLSEPWQLATGQGTPYRVFTPYWRTAQARMCCRR
jgi:Deoxyribodipyrimidine photolyase